MWKPVDYWIKCGLMVRGRISTISRRFGGAGGLGAWEVMRLVQVAFLLFVEYGLEFVAEDTGAMHRLDVQIFGIGSSHCSGSPLGWPTMFSTLNMLSLQTLLEQITMAHGWLRDSLTTSTVRASHGMVTSDQTGYYQGWWQPG